jgi:hypothetical protein
MGVGGASGGKPSAGGCSRWDSTAKRLSFLEEVVCSRGRRLLVPVIAADRLEAVPRSVLGAASYTAQMQRHFVGLLQQDVRLSRVGARLFMWYAICSSCGC